MEELEVALRICELHGDELQSQEVKLFHGCVDYTQDCIETRTYLFPHAAADPISTEGAPMQGDHIRVWYCPACRVAKEKWSTQRKQPPA